MNDLQFVIRITLIVDKGTDMLFMHQSTGRLLVPGCKKTIDNLSKNKPSTLMTYVNCESNIRLDVGSLCIHAQETGWQPSVRLCIIPGLSTYLVQELDVGIV